MTHFGEKKVPSVGCVNVQYRTVLIFLHPYRYRMYQYMYRIYYGIVSLLYCTMLLCIDIDTIDSTMVLFSGLLRKIGIDIRYQISISNIGIDIRVSLYKGSVGYGHSSASSEHGSAPVWSVRAAADEQTAQL